LATARPVQWVISPGGSEQVNTRTLAIVAGDSGRLPGGTGLVAQQTVDAFFAVALLPAPHRRAADASATRHFEDRQPVRRQKHDAGALHVLQRTAAIADDCGQSLALINSEDHTDGLGHAARIAQPGHPVNPVIASVH
jgi:hypothetical protein